MRNEDYLSILNELIDLIRNELQDPDQSELKSPLQITLIWLKSTENDIQFLLFNHDESFSDKNCDVLGPYMVFKKDAFDDLGADIHKSKVSRSLVDNDGVIKADIEMLIKMNIPYLKKGRKNDVIKFDYLGPGKSYMIFLGNLFDSSQKMIINFFHQNELAEKNDIMRHFFQNPEVPPFVQKKVSREELPEEIQEFLKPLSVTAYRMPFLAGYIKPPIWIGPPPYQTDQEGFYSVPLNTYIKIVKHVEILGRRIFLMNDGFLAISINTNLDGQFEYPELEETYKVVDFFLSLLLISKPDGYFEVYSTHVAEFYHIDYDILTKSFDENYGFPQDSPCYSRKMFELRQKIPSRSQFQSVRTRIHPLHIELVLANFKNLLKMDKMRRSLKLLIDSYTHLIRWEFDQSFILSWVLVEQYLNHEWELYLDQKKISNKKKKKYTGKEYTANMKINLLSLLGNLDEDDTHELSRLRRIRNDFMHEISLVEGKDASGAFKLALRFVKKRIDDYFKKKFKKYLKEII